MNRVHRRVCDVSVWDLTLDSLFDVPSQVKCISVLVRLSSLSNVALVEPRFEK